MLLFYLAASPLAGCLWLFLLIKASLGQNNGNRNPLNLSAVPASENFLRRGGARVMVIGDYVYIDGGEVSQLVDETIDGKVSRPSDGVNRTLSIDLTTSWRTDHVTINQIEKRAPERYGQAIFRDDKNDKFYVWGGHYSYHKKPSGVGASLRQIWCFLPDGEGGGLWSNEEPQDVTGFSDLPRTEEGAYASTADAGFYFGGNLYDRRDLSGDERMVPGYLVFNFSSSSSSSSSAVSWSNATEKEDMPWAESGTMANGRAQYIPSFGPNGLIMLLGGSTSSNSDDRIMLEMETVWMMDPITRKWYSQITTGDIPTNRESHCVAGVQGRNGTYEIFLTGGYNFQDEDGNDYEDMYILSVPGFVWTKVYNETEGGSRRFVACEVIGKRQLLSVGGIYPKSDWWKVWRDPDPYPQGLNVFDLTDLEWKGEYDADAEEYETPDVVQSWYDDGGLAKVEWSNNDVKQLFVGGEGSDSPGSGDSDADGGGQGAEGAEGAGYDDVGGSSNIGAIAGGIAGGVAGLAFIGAAVWFLLRRRRQKRSAPAEMEDTQAAPGYWSAEGMGFKSGWTGKPLELHDNSPMAELPQPGHGNTPEMTGSSIYHQRETAELPGDGHMR